MVDRLNSRIIIKFMKLRVFERNMVSCCREIDVILERFGRGNENFYDFGLKV